MGPIQEELKKRIQPFLCSSCNNCTTQSPTEQEHSIYAADMMITSVQSAQLREQESQNKLGMRRNVNNFTVLYNLRNQQMFGVKLQLT